ncbi:MAG TPA: hypothetical protein VFC47_05730 [Caulobacteraceae bacterium]|nr:hypothetical protein [Caulobacteraceae bacterium]
MTRLGLGLLAGLSLFAGAASAQGIHNQPAAAADLAARPTVGVEQRAGTPAPSARAFAPSTPSRAAPPRVHSRHRRRHHHHPRVVPAPKPPSAG